MRAIVGMVLVLAARPVAADPAPSPWALHCKAAIEHGRTKAAAAIEPLLARMSIAIEARPDHDRVSASATPPYVPIGPVHLDVSPTTDDDAPWATHAMYELGGDHRIVRRVANHVEVMISFDGWDWHVAEAVIAVFEPALEPCFSRS